MESLPYDAVQKIADGLLLLNLQVMLYLSCKGVEWATRTFLRRDPPKKLNRSKLARSDGSQ